MKKLIIKWCIRILIIVVIIGTIIGLIKRVQSLNEELSYATNNIAAYAAENSNLKEGNIAFQLSIVELESYQDSLMLKMKQMANDIGIKDKNIRQLQYQLEHFNKRDTIILRDTIFRDPQFHLDTCIMDKWNKTCLFLSYPGNIGITSSYKNEKYIVVNSKKEPIKPGKCKFVNFFRRKHTILEIDVIDKNPYVETERQRFVEIIK